MAAAPGTSPTLLLRAVARDPEAWRRLVALYAPLVEGWCRRAGVGDAAEDVRQEVFRAVAAGLAGFRRDRPGDTFRGWLRGVTRHKIGHHLWAAARQPRADGGSDAHNRLLAVPGPLAADAENPDELRDLYFRALELVRGEFEPRTWEAFWRSAVDGQDTAAVAADLGVTPAAVRKAKSWVLHRLRC